MTSLRVVVNGHRIQFDYRLPEELEDIDVESLQLVMLVRRGSQVVSFAGVPQVIGRVVVCNPDPDPDSGPVTSVPRG